MGSDLFLAKMGDQQLMGCGMIEDIEATSKQSMWVFLNTTTNRHEDFWCFYMFFVRNLEFLNISEQHTCGFTKTVGQLQRTTSETIRNGGNVEKPRWFRAPFPQSTPENRGFSHVFPGCSDVFPMGFPRVFPQKPMGFPRMSQASPRGGRLCTLSSTKTQSAAVSPRAI